MEDGLVEFDKWRKDYLSVVHVPPEILYHYTDVDGLKDIVTSKGFWASNAAYLNDQSEIIHTQKMVKNLLKENFESVQQCNPESPIRKGEQVMARVIDSFVEYLDTYVVCFSSARDLLSQWRGYGTQGGYAIEMDAKKVQEYASSSSALRFVPVIYDQALQQETVKDLMERWRGLFRSQSEWGSEPMTSRSMQLLFAICLSDLAASFKNASFREEQEWRLIYGKSNIVPDDSTGMKVRFRTRQNMLLPYVAIPESPKVLLPIKEILVGPTRYPAHAGYAVQKLLEEVGYERNSIPVHQSAVPLRA